MPTKKHTIRGKAMWAKVFPYNKETRDYQGNPYPWGGLFKIDVILDKENKAIYKASGTSGKGKFDDDGNFIATLKRKENGPFKEVGGPPKVVYLSGDDYDQQMIPNGSEVEVEFSVYTTSMSPGTRLEKVTVLKLADMPEMKKEEEPKPQPKASSGVDIPF